MGLKSIDDFDEIAFRGRSDIYNNIPQIIFGLGTCGISCGAKELINVARKAVSEMFLNVQFVSVGCIGLCYAEPLVDIKLPGRPRVIYNNMTEDKLKKVIRAHLVEDKPLKDFAYVQLNEEVSCCLYNKIVFNDIYNGIPLYKDLPFMSKQYRIALRNCGLIDPVNIVSYIARGGYRSAFKAFTSMDSQTIIDEVKVSSLRGRGGAGFPTGLKWQFVRNAKNNVKYIICNADEGDPGAYMDRAILEGDPFSVLEGMLIGAFAVGANKGFIYVRAEYPLAIERLSKSIEIARDMGLLGDNIFGSGFNFDVHIVEGAGAFVCGEETALIASIEGRRGEPRPRPPFPATHGIYGCPTNVDNVETWANIPPIIERGGQWFASLGTEKSTGTKVFSLVGKINRAGLVEIPMGTALKDIVYEIGGGTVQGKDIKAIQTGGPSGGCIPQKYFDVGVDYESLKALESIVGSGGMVVMDDNTCMVDVARFFLSFICEESCGQCIPCHVGVKRMLEILDKICNGKASLEDLKILEELAVYVRASSLCGLGQTAPNPVLTTIKYFKDEYISHILDKKCSAHICKNLIEYFIISEKCSGCNLCKKMCPENAISGEPKHIHTIVKDKCTRCGTCIENCKFNAIVVN